MIEVEVEELFALVAVCVVTLAVPFRRRYEWKSFQFLSELVNLTPLDASSYRAHC